MFGIKASILALMGSFIISVSGFYYLCMILCVEWYWLYGRICVMQAYCVFLDLRRV